ncbi:MAG: hypothetical protein M3483_03775 [Gemmatimonadota bacterium]|nr:hypothetical protein [Gemmatimonadota bacterium]
MTETLPYHSELQDLFAILDRADRPALLAHVRTCGACAEGLSALCTTVNGAEAVAMDAARSAKLRSRLVFRARGDRMDEERHAKARGRGWVGNGVGVRRSIGVAGGWLVAAGLASLLLTHHTFHTSLSGGWILASVLGILLVLSAWMMVVLRRRTDSLNEHLAATERELKRLRPFA